MAVDWRYNVFQPCMYINLQPYYITTWYKVEYTFLHIGDMMAIFEIHIPTILLKCISVYRYNRGGKQ